MTDRPPGQPVGGVLEPVATCRRRAEAEDLLLRGLPAIAFLLVYLALLALEVSGRALPPSRAGST